jgi:hypothetical protein
VHLGPSLFSNSCATSFTSSYREQGKEGLQPVRDLAGGNGVAESSRGLVRTHEATWLRLRWLTAHWLCTLAVPRGASLVAATSSGGRG